MERKLLVSNLTIGYEGLFDAEDFFKFIEDWFAKHGYDKNEKRNIERVGEKAKNLQLDLIPFKDVSEYARYEIHLKIRINDLITTKIKKDKSEIKINKGKVNVAMDAFLATDIKYRWASNPFLFFMRTIFDKFLHREYISTLEKGVIEDLQNFHSELKAYLNLERYKEQA